MAGILVTAEVMVAEKLKKEMPMPGVGASHGWDGRYRMPDSLPVGGKKPLGGRSGCGISPISIPSKLIKGL